MVLDNKSVDDVSWKVLM